MQTWQDRLKLMVEFMLDNDVTFTEAMSHYYHAIQLESAFARRNLAQKSIEKHRTKLNADYDVLDMRKSLKNH